MLLGGHLIRVRVFAVAFEFAHVAAALCSRRAPLHLLCLPIANPPSCWERILPRYSAVRFKRSAAAFSAASDSSYRNMWRRASVAPAEVPKSFVIRLATVPRNFIHMTRCLSLAKGFAFVAPAFLHRRAPNDLGSISPVTPPRHHRTDANLKRAPSVTTRSDSV
jgi:hypothetical protein